MLQNLRPEALKKLLESPTLHNVALNEQVRRDAAAVSHISAAENARKITKAIQAQQQAQRLHDALEGE